MAIRKVVFVQGGYYHVYNRGADRQLLFLDDENYRFLLRRIKDYAQRFAISVIAYCLMPNHYHFVLRQDSDASISSFVQAVFNSYTKAFNKMHDRSGTLFQGPFRATAILDNSHLVHVCRYVHRNPLDGGLVERDRLSDWQYSSYLEWLGQRKGSLVDSALVLDLFPDPGAYQRFVLDYVPPKHLERAVRLLTGDRRR